MMNLTFLTPLGSIAALLFALYLTAKVLKADKGSKEVQDISGAVRKGANAYLKRQYKGVAFSLPRCLLS